MKIHQKTFEFTDAELRLITVGLLEVAERTIDRAQRVMDNQPLFFALRKEALNMITLARQIQEARQI